MIDSLPLVLTGLGLTASIVYYASILRNQNKTRQTQLFMNFYESYRSIEFRKQFGIVMRLEYTDYEDFMEKYGMKKNPDTWATWQFIASYFNGVGILLKKRIN